MSGLHLHHCEEAGREEPIGRVDAIERAICQETCAFRGEPACWKVCPEAWPNTCCDEPGCRALAVVAEIAVRKQEIGQ